ncbi:MFS transporter [Nocardia aurantia]|uniref:Putative multidrug resistance protein MdtD n=1 Tax=Nocardia aurantia TaxID=2585199 RepID=A0A7K0DXX4_9NOCA|nr:MFS transporter [Nocardia aurantia]MQY30639.1 putative multidrug resistance protein MdtD [Nocardia aurantia]
MSSDIRLSTAAGRWVLLATVLGSGMAMMDATVVNVALPRIGSEFGASMAGLQWTVNAYTLTLAGFVLLGGSLGDRFGRRRVFLIGVVWFALASALCAVAQDIPMLVAARALQGVGGALLTPGALAIIQASFTPDDRPRAVGAWSGLGGIAGAAGPFLGGWLVDVAGWRWVFLLNLPLAVLVIAVAARHVPETSDDSARGRFDVLGAALAAAALAGITYALTEAPTHTANRLLVLLATVAGVGAAAWFIVVERRRSHDTTGPQPMLPTQVFRSRQFTAVNGVTFVVYGAMGVVFFLLPLTLQVVSGFSPIVAGAAMLPVTVVMLLLSAPAGGLAQRIGPRIPMTVGLVVAAAGMLLMLRVGRTSTYPGTVLPAVFVFGLGLAAMVAPLTATVLASADPRHAGIASGVNNAVARAAGLLGVAAVPPLAGLGGEAYTDPALFASGFHHAIVACAITMLAGAALTTLTVSDNTLRAAPESAAPQCKTHCSIAAPPLDRVPAQDRWGDNPRTGRS